MLSDWEKEKGLVYSMQGKKKIEIHLSSGHVFSLPHS